MKTEEKKQTPMEEWAYPVSNADLSAAIMQTGKLLGGPIDSTAARGRLADHLIDLLDIQKNRMVLIRNPQEFQLQPPEEKTAPPVEEKNPRRDWSPLHVKLLIHAHCAPFPWPDGNATSDRFQDDLLGLGLIEKTTYGYYDSTLKGRACVDKICQLPH